MDWITVIELILFVIVSIFSFFIQGPLNNFGETEVIAKDKNGNNIKVGNKYIDQNDGLMIQVTGCYSENLISCKVIDSGTLSLVVDRVHVFNSTYFVPYKTPLQAKHTLGIEW